LHEFVDAVFNSATAVPMIKQVHGEVFALRMRLTHAGALACKGAADPNGQAFKPRICNGG
jgi:hypothetical protein